MPAIKGAREELERLKRELAQIDAGDETSDLETQRRRRSIEEQMLRLETAILKYDCG